MWVDLMYKICNTEKRLYYSLGKPFPRHCPECGTKLEKIEGMNTIRDLANNGHRKDVMFILQHSLGHIPPSCAVSKSQGKISCTYLKEIYLEDKFKELCLMCQGNLFRELVDSTIQ